MIRLNKYMAQSGVAARRKCDELIDAGKVKVNGKVVDTLGQMIDEITDQVEVSGKAINRVSEFTYILLNKPGETVTTADDQFARQTVVDLVGSSQRIFPVGRLDYNTTGVLLLTDDGNLTNRLIHPKFKAPKIYQVLIDRRIKPIDLHRFKTGILIEEKKTLPCKIREIRAVDNCSLLEVELREGRKRQIRMMFQELGYEVEELERISFAGLTCSGLKRGQWRYLTAEEVERLKGL